MAEVARRKREASAAEQVCIAGGGATERMTNCAIAPWLQLGVGAVQLINDYALHLSLQELAKRHSEVDRLQNEEKADNGAIDALGYQTLKCKAVCVETAAVCAKETKLRRSLQQRAMDA